MLNVGVVMLAPAVGFLKVRTRKAVDRLKQAFPDLDDAAFIDAMLAVDRGFATVMKQVGIRSHAYVEMHFEGSSVEPWSLPERSCVFGTLVDDPEWKRVYVVLKDTAEKPNPQTTRTLLRLMLASGADD